jgi:hypothetical protein
MTATATNDIGTGAGMEVDPALSEAGGAGDPKIVSLRSVKNRAADERIPAFSIDGVTYSILTKPKTNQGLRYIHISRTQGQSAGIDYMLETLLGKDGYQALMDFDDLTEDDLEAVIKAASGIMAGAVEAPKGKPAKGSRRSAG